jgi:DNA-binding transcriptional MerR regulator
VFDLAVTAWFTVTDMQTITDVARLVNVSARTLRHYESLGLVRPQRDPFNDYRLYSDEDVRAIRVVLKLRNIGLPLPTILTMICEPSRFHAELSAHEQQLRLNAGELSNVILALSALRNTVPAGMLTREQLLKAILITPRPAPTPCTIGPQTTNPLTKETQMQRLNVRIVHLPSACVVASRAFSRSPESDAFEPIIAFLNETNQLGSNPQLRVFGFNSPSPVVEGEPYGYEVWVTVPDGSIAPAGLELKSMPGGNYAAHAINFGDFHEWQVLSQWVEDSEKWERKNGDGSRNMDGCLEESLNVPGFLANPKAPELGQLDLLVPVVPRLNIEHPSLVTAK